MARIKNITDSNFASTDRTAHKGSPANWICHQKHYIVAVLIVWTTVIGVSLAWTLREQQQATNEMARNQARAGFDRDIIFRRWNAAHGGVYVPITKVSPPNLYLDVPEREIETPSGKKLTLINPAYMVRQVYEMGEEADGIQGHITSLNPIRPENAPDPWEAVALKGFENGETERSSIETFRGEPYLRLMRPFYTEKGCLKCHGHQGYKEGDVRGGISISVPMAPLRVLGQKTTLLSIGRHGAFWLLGLVGIGIVFRLLVRHAQQLADKEAQARESENRFMDVIYASDDAILLIDGETFIDCNEATARMLEYSSRERFLLTHPSELSPPEQPDGRSSFEKAQEMMQAAFENGSHRFEWTHRKASGENFPVEVTLTPVTYHGKTILHCLWRDLTERKQIEEERDRSLQTMEKILEFMPVGVVIIGKDKNVRHANSAALAMMGYDSHREILGRKCYQVLCPAQEDSCPILDLGMKTDNAERILIDKNKKKIPILKTVVPITINGEDVLLETFVDISERKQVELDLLRSETKFRTLYDLGSDAVMLLDEEGFFDCNDATIQMFGCKNRTTFCTKHPADLSPIKQPCGTDSVTLSNRLIIAAMKNGDNRFEWVHKRMDTGENFSAEVLLNAMELDGKQVLQAVVRDISERKRAELSLETAKEEAEKANQAKSQFLASMSHELRTPLTGILGFTDLMLASDVDEKEQRDYLQTIRSSGRHLLELINDILDLSKIEAGRLDMERATCAPHEILNDVVSIMRAQAQGKGIDLHCRWSGEVPEVVETDESRLHQILLNLVGNAVKFTSQGSVEVVAHLEPFKEGYKLFVDVTDSGIGVPEEKLRSIFEPFIQADNTVTRNFGGTGLGLAISIRLARALGGDITVTSKVGLGSTFTVSVDVGDLAGVEMLAAPPADGIQAGESTAFSFDSPLPRAAKILLVEDGETNRKLISMVLKRVGLSVDAAENGAIGVEMATENHFDLILMDMQMPVLDGYAASRKLREQGYKKPIIAMTAHAMKGDKEKCMAAGCSHYVSKPISIDKLLAIVAKILSSTVAT